MENRGLLITLEGIDGAGKSVQARHLTRNLEEHGFRTALTREPGGGTFGAEFRKLLSNENVGRWTPETEILLFMADRRHHLDTVIIPALAENKVVVCDRFADSTRAYQGFASSPLRKLVDQLHVSTIEIEPSLTFVIDVPAEVALTRTVSRSGTDKRLESFGEDIESLRRGFQDIAHEFPNRCVLVDGTGSEDDIARELLDRSLKAIS